MGRLTDGYAGRSSGGWAAQHGETTDGSTPACPVGFGCNQRQEGIRLGAQPREGSAELTED
jgi:hypothetical protein